MESLENLLRDLKLFLKYSSSKLLVGLGSASLFEAILKGARMCTSLLRPLPKVPIRATLLPPVLNVQIDNAMGNNKNWYVFTFWSLLVAKKIFWELYMSFMLVDHMHNNIDALFGRWKMQLKKESFPTIPVLIQFFKDVDSVPTIPHLIEEVPNFKAFIERLILEGDEALVRHTKAQQFKFYLNSMGVSIMKYNR